MLKLVLDRGIEKELGLMFVTGFPLDSAETDNITDCNQLW